MAYEGTYGITIAYDGEPVRNGSMNVHQLGNALLAIGDLLNAANRVLNQGSAVIDVTVEAEFRKGSFGIDFNVVQRAVDTATMILPVLPPEDLKSAGEVLKALFGAGTGLVSLLRKLKGHEPAKVTPAENGTMRVEVKDSPGSQVNVIQVSAGATALHGDRATRQAMDRMLEPLETKGMEKLEVRQKLELRPGDDTDVVEAIGAEEAKYFRAPPPPDFLETLHDAEHEAVFEVVSLSLYGGKKWKLSSNGGKDQIEVTIADKDFLEDIARHQVSFERGIALRVRLKTVTSRKPDGSLSSKYTATKVLEVIHFSRPTQLPLPK